MWKVLVQNDRRYKQITVEQSQLQHITLFWLYGLANFTSSQNYHQTLKLLSIFSEEWWLPFTDRQTDRQTTNFIIQITLTHHYVSNSWRLYRQNLKGSKNSTLYYIWLTFWTLFTVLFIKTHCFRDFNCLLLKAGMNKGNPTVGPIQKSLPLLLDLFSSF